MKRILLVMSHPDDESFTCGGTIPMYVEAGWRVDLLCATRGEEGNTGPLVSLARKDVGATRQKELEKAGTMLGIRSVTFLGYQDGTLADLTPGQLEDTVHQKMMEMVPDIVITHDTTGGTNHPDHMKLCFATTFAFQKYAKWIESELKEQEPGEQLFPKLYYSCMPDSIISYAVQKKIYPNESFGKPWRGVEDKKITTAVDISDYRDVKEKAIRCHVTQTADAERFMKVNDHMKHEYFIFRMHGTTEVFMGKNDHVADHL